MPEFDEIRAALLKDLPEYMVPSSFVVLEGLPLTPNGKLDTRALPMPEIVSGQIYRAPRSASEVLLCKLYEELTGARQVGLDDGFFALGGDSITSIRLVSRARQAGLGFSVRDVFAHPTVAALAQAARAIEQGALSLPAPAAGPVGLTPIQYEFLTEGGPLGRFHQAIAVEPPLGVGCTQVAGALAQLLRHHDALRLRVVQPERAEQDIEFWLDAAAPDAQFELEMLDLSGQSGPTAELQMQAALGALPARLDPHGGRMMAGVWVQRDGGQRGVLLLAVHHLVVDGVSWRVLLEDLDHLTAGRALPGRTHSMRDWAQYLEAQSRSGKRLAELAIWREVVSGAVLLPSEGEVLAEHNVIGEVLHHESRVSAKLLEQLLSATAVYRAGIDDLLLTALGLAVYGWRRDFYGVRGDTGALLIDLEGHGRESEDSELDLTRTVGWFTSAHPVRVDFEGFDLDQALQGGVSAGLALRAMKEGLRRTSDRGLGYGILRWFNPQTRQALAGLPQAQMAFNYLGRFERSEDSAQQAGEGWKLSDNVLVGGQDDPKRRRHHLLEVNAGIDGSGALGIGWGYHPGAHSQASVVDLAERFNQALEAIARHCHETPLLQKLTPSDFPLAKQVGLDQALLDQLVQVSGFEEVLPLAPLQQGLAYESWSQGEQRQNDPYHVQLAVGLEGVLDTARLKQSFERLVARHRVLRLSLPIAALERGLGVYRQLPLDWRVEPAEGRTLEAILKEDHAQAFDLGNQPLIRVRVIEQGSGRYTLVVANHHVLLDGWSTPIFMNELTALYGGEELEPTLEWRDHLAWLATRDREAALAYWRGHFAGAQGAGAVPLPRPQVPGVGMGEHTITLSGELTGALEAFARQNDLTISMVFEGAFMLLLARLSGQSEVTIGMTRSGRSAERAGIDRAIGLFIGTLPLRADVALGAGLIEWLKDLQQEQAGQEEHGHLSLSEIQRCANLTAAQSLFDVLFVYENYPVDEAVQTFAEELKIESVYALDGTHYPLALAVTPGREARLRFTFDRGQVDEAALVVVGERLTLMFETFVTAQPETRLGEMTALLETERDRVLKTFNQSLVAVAPATLPELFERQVAERPDATALIFEEQRVSY
ncbi:MAG: hypothetical protein HOF85_02280, partial [Acidiferrobacteraceae bacterium]|nr:hypothetical protein [Acidiferrobacteraceae bacterium]